MYKIVKPGLKDIHNNKNKLKVRVRKVNRNKLRVNLTMIILSIKLLKMQTFGRISVSLKRHPKNQISRISMSMH